MNLEQANRLGEGEDREKVQLYVEIAGELKAIGTAYMRSDPSSKRLVLVPTKARIRKGGKEDAKGEGHASQTDGQGRE